MVFVLVAGILCLVTVYTVRESTITNPRILLAGFDGPGVLAGFVVFIFASVGLGIEFAVALILSFLLHELGHVLGYRMLGYEDAKFRLVPVLSDMPISDEPVRDEGHAFMIAIMGPGLSIAPMVLAFALSTAFADIDPVAANFLMVFAVTCGTFNFINLLPFSPLDGGRCAQIFARNFWPVLAPALAVFMISAFAVAAWRTGSLMLLVLAGVGLQGLLRKTETEGKALGPDLTLTAMAAYAFTLAAHFSGGYLLISQYL